MVERDRGMERRSFVGTLAVLALPGAGLRLPGLRSAPADAGAKRDGDGRPLPAAGFRNDLERVESVVGASHGDFDRVRALVEEQPALAKASWDWGFGDWETALGAASHTGRREIAEFLIAHGARPTLFSAAMLGQVDTVRAYLEADPGLYALHGPHGIPLLNHARAGREQAKGVLDYLLETFGPDERPFGFTADADIEARYTGRYRFSDDPPIELGVAVRNDYLLVGPGERPSTRVNRAGPDTFHPTGAPGVRLRFDVVDGRARSLTVIDGPTEITGVRVEG